MDDKRGPYLLWGLATRFAHFVPGADAKRRPTIGLLIEWNSLDDAQRALQAMPGGVQVPGVYTGARGRMRRVWAVDVAIDDLDRFLAAVEPHARRMELSGPVAPASAAKERIGPRVSNTEVLAGVMDDGCAFANGRFVLNGSSRLLWLWNQDPAARGAPSDGNNGPPGTSFGYGGQWSRDELDGFIAGGSQERAYRGAALPGLARAAAHGTHVMDLLAGGKKWDLVFVQFSQAGVDDPSGVWLDRYAIDGLDYILACAGPNTKKVVVNISWGPQTGAHDGSSWLESVIDDLVESQPQSRELIVSLAAGNSYRARAHGQLDCASGGSIGWIVPPDGATPAFLEVWWPRGVSPQDARMRAVSPSGRVIDLVPGAFAGAKEDYALAGMPGQGAMAMFAVHPTSAADLAVRGEHGRWRFEFDPGAPRHAGDIHLYVARADHNMGRRRLAKASYLVDDALLRARFAPPAQRRGEAPGSAVRHAGTLSGIATGRRSKVAAGYVHAGYASPPYSSSGASRGLRKQPDYACVTDHSAAVPGVHAAGVRTGTTMRMAGTSTAAPQLGRHLAAQTLVAIFPPGQVPARIGAGCVQPDEGVIHRP